MNTWLNEKQLGYLAIRQHGLKSNCSMQAHGLGDHGATDKRILCVMRICKYAPMDRTRTRRIWISHSYILFLTNAHISIDLGATGPFNCVSEIVIQVQKRLDTVTYSYVCRSPTLRSPGVLLNGIEFSSQYQVK